MKRHLWVILMVLMLLPLAQVRTHAAEVASGTCGDNLTWVLDDEETLTISGTGDMTNWETSTRVPWYSNRDSIMSLQIGSNVTSIGRVAFHGCTELTSVRIPDSVTSIGEGAFYGCTGLMSITVNSSNIYYSSESGILFNKEKMQFAFIQLGNREHTRYLIVLPVSETWRLTAVQGCQASEYLTVLPASATQRSVAVQD